MTQEARQRIAATAGHWDARLRAPGCTEAERAAFVAWRDAHPAHRAAFERLQTLVAGLRHEKSRVDLRALRDAALSEVTRVRSRNRALIAASVVLTVAVAGWLWMPRVAPPADALQAYSTGIGQRSSVALRDGSTIELNAASRVIVAFTTGTRAIALLEGQAVFRVAKDSQRPFVVTAGGRNITAIGTVFDVHVDASKLHVTLLEGMVAVTPSGSRVTPRIDPAHPAIPGNAIGPHAGADTVYLSPGEQLVADSKALPLALSPAAVTTVRVKKVDAERVAEWRSGRVFMEDLSLAEAVAEMNKYSAVQIHLADASLATLRVNGMFRAGEQREFTHALQEYFSIVAEQPAEDRIVLRRR